ncbi:MAG: DUF2490 domain-containing protein [Alistipes sp.]
MKLIFSIAAVVFFAATGFAQDRITYDTTEETDLQLWTGFSINKRIVKGFDVTWSEELRLKNTLTDLDRIYSVLAVSYEFCPYFKAAVDYTFLALSKDNGWELRHRTNLDLTGSYRINPRWKLSLRERFRMTTTTADTDPLLSVNPLWVMRSRLMAEYTVFSLPIKPYVYFELSNTLTAPKIIANFVDKIRASVGVKYALSAHSEFEFYYRFDVNTAKEINRTAGNAWRVCSEKEFDHILGVFYEYSF